jgi:hypothetical protein
MMEASREISVTASRAMTLAREAARWCHQVVRLDMGEDCIQKNGMHPNPYLCPACQLRIMIERMDNLTSTQHIENSDEGARSILRNDRMNEQAMDKD